MPVPGYQEFMRPLLDVFSDGHDHNVRVAYAAVADRLGLTEADRQELIPSGTQRLLDNRAGWAKTYLVKAGLLESPRRAFIRLAARGRQALTDTARIDSRYLRRFPEFLEFAGGDGDVKAPDVAQSRDASVITETTPEERILSGFQQVQSALASDLLERVKAASPTFFERLVVQLLVSMGYGGSMEDAGKAIGRSGDEGIDGIIKEDRLGLDVIYLQAKRWERTIGRPEIQQFAGALQGQRARKGVFITTSSLSGDARDYAGRIDTRIILIDSTELGRLMIAHGVGVTPIAIYELKRVDSDFFAED